MKRISNLFAMLFMGALAVTSFTACSDDDDDITLGGDKDNPTVGNQWTGVQAEMWEVANQYVNQVVFPTYKNLAASADVLYEQAVTMQQKHDAGTLTDADVEAACEAFKAAREYWEKSEAFLYGAATDYNLDPHMDSWPLDQGQMADFLSNPTMVAGLYSDDPIAFVNQNNANFDTALGFHGLEFVLFRDGAPRKAAVYDGIEDHPSFANVTVQCADELAFLVAVAGDVRDNCYRLEVSWLGLQADATHQARVAQLGVKTHALDDNGYYYGADMLLAGTDGSSYASINAALVTLVGPSGCGNIANEVASQKIGQAYRVATGAPSLDPNEPDAIDYIESPYSKRSYIDYRDNIYSIKNSLYGNIDQAQPADKSVMTFLRRNGYSGVDDLQNALDDAIAKLTTCVNSGIAFVDDPGAQQAGDAMQAVDALNTQLEAASQWISSAH
jgi:hypothetical protein